MESVSTALTLALPIPWPEFSPELREILLSIGVSLDHKPVHILTKLLQKSDINSNLGRLLMAKRQMKASLSLSADEDAKLRSQKKLDVKVIDPSLKVRNMKLASWKIGSSDPSLDTAYYTLIQKWSDVVDCNGLVKGDVVQVWSFRYNGESLGLIVVKEKASSSLSNDGLSSWGRKKIRGTNCNCADMNFEFL